MAGRAGQLPKSAQNDRNLPEWPNNGDSGGKRTGGGSGGGHKTDGRTIAGRPMVAESLTSAMRCLLSDDHGEDFR